MSNKVLFSLAASAALLLSACGDDITEVTEVNEVGMKVIEKGEALPKCSSDNEGAMIYAVDSAAAYFCVNRKWTSMKGEKGDQGEPGKDGKQGKQGEQGDKGEAGDAGSSCTMEALPDSSGFKVLCGGDSVGVVLNGASGEKGETGAKGDQGDKGDKGIGCSLLDDGNGSVKVTCGEGNEATTTTLYKAMCGNVPYDPETIAPLYCENNSFYMKDSRDNQIYRVVIIGTQTWMAQNMNYKTNSSRCYNNEEANCETDGSLYYVGDSLEVCPSGWHLPDTSEYRILINAAGGAATAGKMLKSTSGWLTEDDQDGSGTDAYGFSIIPAGYFYTSVAGPGSDYESKRAYFWTRSQGNNENEGIDYYSLRLTSNSDKITIELEPAEGHFHSCYMSVRCIKD